MMLTGLLEIAYLVIFKVYPSVERTVITEINTIVWCKISLVPRPFPPPVFDRLQYKNGGEGLGERVTCVTSGRREGGGARRRISRSFL